MPTGQHVLHTCDNPPCCNPEHLFLGTQQANMQDKIRKGRTAKGERHGSKTHPERVPRGADHPWNRHPELVLRGAAHPWRKHPELIRRGEQSPTAKLTADQVREIRRRVAAGEPQAVLGREFVVSAATICNIIKRKVWVDVPD